jgi:hypothetical protein
VLLFPAAKHQPSAPTDHDGQQIGKKSEEEQRHIREPGPGATGRIADLRDIAHIGPTRVVGRIAGKREHEVERDHHEGPHRPLAERTLHIIA